MDLKRRAEGYRDVALRCPGCAEPMTSTPAQEGDVDLCSACGGIWLDWFDGDVRTASSEVLATSAEHAAAAPAARNEERASGACPRCGTQLVAERHPATGVDLRRCEHCAGVFVNATSAAILAASSGASVADEPPAPETGWLARLAAALRGLLRS
jgi:Zn-finger nucleic acid-binding protein